MNRRQLLKTAAAMPLLLLPKPDSIMDLLNSISPGIDAMGRIRYKQRFSDRGRSYRFVITTEPLRHPRHR